MFIVVFLMVYLGYFIRERFREDLRGLSYRKTQNRVHILVDELVALNPGAETLTCRWAEKSYRILIRSLPYPFRASPFKRTYRLVQELELMESSFDDWQRVCLVRTMTFCQLGMIFSEPDIYDAETMERIAGDTKPRGLSFSDTRSVMKTPELLFLSLDELRRIESLLLEIPPEEWTDET